MRFFLCALVLLFGLPKMVSGAQSALQQDYLQVYLSINDAQKLEDKKDYLGAFAHFETCLHALDLMHRWDAGWERALLLRRMSDCENEIRKLQPLAAEQVLDQVKGAANWAQLNGYLAAAEGAEQIGQKWEALVAYQKYADALQIVHQHKPQWNHELVAGEIPKTAKKIFTLEQTTVYVPDSANPKGQ